ncbi:hypothetical protein WAI453_001696 [Rhynchosporium graminicola]
MPVASEWESLDSQIEKLEDEEDSAVAEFYARIARLKKQKRFLYERRQKMITTGLNSIAELDTLKALEKEEKEKQEREGAPKDAELAGAEPSSTDVPVDPSFDLTVDLPFDPADPL